MAEVFLASLSNGSSWMHHFTTSGSRCLMNTRWAVGCGLDCGEEYCDLPFAGIVAESETNLRGTAVLNQCLSEENSQVPCFPAAFRSCTPFRLTPTQLPLFRLVTNTPGTWETVTIRRVRKVVKVTDSQGTGNQTIPSHSESI